VITKHLTVEVAAPTEAEAEALITELARSCCDIANSAESEDCHVHLADAASDESDQDAAAAKPSKRWSVRVGRLEHIWVEFDSIVEAETADEAKEKALAGDEIERSDDYCMETEDCDDRKLIDGHAPEEMKTERS
jgi:hypothetical protein